jgi:hypothetical protein
MYIFISYRRSDTEAVVRRMYDRVMVHFGRSSVFLDVDTIPLGIDFRQALGEAVDRCDVLLAVVGHDWLNATDETGCRRLDSEDDYLRFEIERALSRGIPVIPVLVENATMPSADSLPPSLREFAFKNGIPISDGLDFERDLTRLIRSLESSRSIAWVECANCLETIIPMANGMCPSCRRHALEAPDSAGAIHEGGGQAMIRIQEGARLPPMCCICASPTERLVKIRRSHRVGGESNFVRMLLAGTIYSLVLGDELRENSRDVVLHMPLCKACSAKQRLNPVYVDFEHGTMKFLVHREFRLKCKELL